jgi:serine/threonine-protein kinase
MSDPLSQSDKTPATADLSGQLFGNFRVLRRLGRGAMAEVYLAEQQQLQRRVALKVLRPELAGDEVYLKRFEREAQAAASLVHANIVQIHEVGHVGPYHYIAQEYVEGLNLREWISRNGPPDLVHALSVMRQAAAALAKAAEQGIVHRDIKPENIMLTRSGEVKVADFGLARFAREGDAVELTQAGMTLGTPLYMSPEQVEGKALDTRSDIYSLGVTCYHMLCGAPPFAGDTALAVAVQHLKKQARPLEELRPDLPPALCRMIHKMLAKTTAQRYASPQELLRELRRLQKESFGDQWPEELPDWESTAALPPPLSAHATQRLDELMKTMIVQSRVVRPRWGLLFATSFAAFVAGGVIAWLTMVDVPLLGADGAGSFQVPHQEKTALRQVFLASQLGTEEAWRAVAVYFPKNEYLVRRADQQRARIALGEGNYRLASTLFQKFAAMDDEEYRAFGLAGECGVLSLERKYKESSAVAERLWPIREKLADPRMRDMVTRAIERDRSSSGAQSSSKWKEWLDEQFQRTD